MLPINVPLIGEEEIRAAVRVLRSGLLTDKGGRGPNVTRFERAFAKFVGTKYAVALNTGTSAIHSALLAAQVGKGDEVILQVSHSLLQLKWLHCLELDPFLLTSTDSHTVWIQSW